MDVCNFVRFLLFASALTFTCHTSLAQSFDGKVSATQIAELREQPLTLILRSGLTIDDGKFIQLIVDPRNEGAKFLEYQRGRRNVKAKAEDIYRFFVGGRPFIFRYHGPSKTFHLIDLELSDSTVDNRLTGLGRSRVEPTDPESLAQLNNSHRQFAQDSVRTLGDPSLRIEENDFAILLTDFPPLQTKVFSQFVPVVFEYMNQRFGLPKDETVLPGKAVIALFRNRAYYSAFETQVMKNANFGTSTSILHYSSTRFVTVRNDDNLDSNTVYSICWSIAGGYLDRYYSNVDLPAWLNQGLRAVIAQQGASSSSQQAQRTKEEVESAVTQLRKTGSLDQILGTSEVPQDRRYLATLLTKFLVNRDPLAMTQFVKDIKSGIEPEAALEANFGLTYASFASSFGVGLRLPGITP